MYNRYRYRVVESFCPECNVATYGISVHSVRSFHSRYLFSIQDISPDKQAVAKLAQRCQHHQLAPIHLMDVIEDFLL